MQSKEKGKDEWKRSFAKLRWVKSIPVNMASRNRTLQDFAEIADEWQTK